ncbi:hypothetical protein I601_3222 [Nocardioides dokdonensis FR1436]|uniref:DUF4440 domain-containing protein n=1 Tax=Nocardioides dokdonensis FR1436 TaxID=1300347 RepID=A0A1A9GMW1_9ACTN|nr:hypothetical protein [Nocardioides dokdonensis]ANH39629.1 hypothetical protein I601_3222 [Nocardioides dokdonensis FR1436]
MPIALLLVLLLLGAAAGFAAGRSAGPGGPDLTASLRRRDAFIEHLREVAWRDRDIAPELSTVLLDDIRVFTADPDGWERRTLG